MGFSLAITDVQITDNENDYQIEQEAFIHVQCTNCGHEQMLEFGLGGLTGPCDECSTPGTEETRTLSKIKTILDIRDFMDLSVYPPADFNDDYEYSIEMLISDLGSAVEMIEAMADEGWELGSLDTMVPFTFDFYREVTDSDEIKYDELCDREEQYMEELAERREENDLW